MIIISIVSNSNKKNLNTQTVERQNVEWNKIEYKLLVRNVAFVVENVDWRF